MDFEEKIRKRLQSLNKEQICQFAWLCGVRILPFLNTERDFACWIKNNRQRYLYSIFSALDICVIRDFAAARAAATAAARAAAAADDNVAFAAATASARAAFAAANAARAAATAARAAAFADTDSDAADNAARAAATAAVAALNASESISIEKILFEDINAIKNGKLTTLSNNTGIYGDIWNNFLDDLNTIACGYWARLYENLFKNRFVIDKKELERRLSVPDEIKEQGAAVVGRYLERLGDDVERLNEARIIILGEKGAGKTSLARRLLDIDAPMPKEYESTEGVETAIWKIEDEDGKKSINAHIWDFAGHSITHSAHQCFMSARCLYIYVYNGRIERDNDPTYWLEQIRIHGGISPVLFLINEKDDHNADVAERTLKKEYRSIQGYYRVDIGSDDKTKLEEFRQTVMGAVRNNLSWNSQIVSAEAYKIKSDLREYFTKTNEPHIERKQFDSIAQKYEVRGKRIEEILGDLHALGVCLWYKEEEIQDFKMLVLNPDWITDGIYRIINEGFKEHKHKLTVSDGVEMLKNNERYAYPDDKVKYLFQLMRVYELAFFESDDHIFIPGILTIDSPDDLPEFPYGERLKMCFTVDKALPPNVVCRLIVQRHKEIVDEKHLWRKGVVLRYGQGDATALVVEDGRNISVEVKGADKTAYISSLRETLKGIFDNYKVIKPNLLYEVLVPEEDEKKESPNSREETPIMLSEETINGHLQAKRPYFDASQKRDIPLDMTAREYAIIIAKVFKSISPGCSTMIGLTFAFIIAITALCGGIVLILLEKPLVGCTAAIIGAIAALAKVFVYGKHRQPKKSKHKRSPRK